jgi:hypothetical protein
MSDLQGTPSEKRKDTVIAALLKDPNVKYFEPYMSFTINALALKSCSQALESESCSNIKSNEKSGERIR